MCTGNARDLAKIKASSQEIWKGDWAQSVCGWKEAQGDDLRKTEFYDFDQFCAYTLFKSLQCFNWQSDAFEIEIQLQLPR